MKDISKITQNLEKGVVQPKKMCLLFLFIFAKLKFVFPVCGKTGYTCSVNQANATIQIVIIVQSVSRFLSFISTDFRWIGASQCIRAIRFHFDQMNFYYM